MLKLLRPEGEGEFAFGAAAGEKAALAKRLGAL